MASCCPTDALAAARSLQGAHDRAAGRRGHVSARNERELRDALQRALDFGKGVAHVLDRGEVQRRSRRKRACPSCGRSFAELDPRLFSYNSKHGWCENCFGTGVRITGFDAEQSGEEIWWNEWFDGEAARASAATGSGSTRSR